MTDPASTDGIHVRSLLAIAEDQIVPVSDIRALRDGLAEGAS